MARFTGKVAIVTGAAQGIGAATATRLASEGAQVAIVDRDAAPFVCDVTDEDQVSATVQAVMGEFGRLDILVNNAGVSPGALVEDLTLDVFNQVMTVNATGTFLFCRAFLRAVDGPGKIVNVGSRAALGFPGRANYAASKAAIHALTATLAEEAGPRGINVNAVAPGYVVTAMTAASAAREGLRHEEAQRRAAERIALRRVASPDDIAAVIAFLASDDASYISGQVIYVTGGPG